MQGTVLVPVDFKDHAFQAYLYANNLAYRLDMPLHLVHVFPGASVGEGPDWQSKEERREVLVEKLKSFSHWHPNEVQQKVYPVPTTYEVLEGDPVAELVHAADRKDIAFIVAGTRDEHNLAERWLGTVSLGICRRAAIPVLLVPHGCYYRDIRHIVVAVDYHVDEFETIREIQALSEIFRARLHFIHVQVEADDDFEYIEQDLVETLVTFADSNLQVDTTTIVATDIVGEILQYVEQKQGDLLVMIAPHRPFFEKVLHRSITRKTLLETDTPTLVLRTINTA